MRTVSRLGVAAAATLFASVTALAGAGVATAEEPAAPQAGVQQSEQCFRQREG